MNYAYLRISTYRQDLSNQLHEIIDYCKSKGIDLNSRNIFQEVVSSRQNKTDRVELLRLLTTVKKGDTVIISDLSRLGRSNIEILETAQDLLKEDIELRLAKENLVINGADSITAKLIIPMLSALNEIERDRISQRTKNALAARKKKGVKLGRPKGSLSGSKLDQHLPAIKELLAKEVSVVSIAKIIGTSKQNLHRYIKTRRLKEELGKKIKNKRHDDAKQNRK